MNLFRAGETQASPRVCMVRRSACAFARLCDNCRLVCENHPDEASGGPCACGGGAILSGVQ